VSGIEIIRQYLTDTEKDADARPYVGPEIGKLVEVLNDTGKRRLYRVMKPGLGSTAEVLQDITEAEVNDHGALGGLTDDDHTQYVLVTGARAFTGTVGGITPVAGSDLATKDYVDGAVTSDHGGLSGLLDDDHTQYILVDGTRAFSGDIDAGGFSLTNVNLVDGKDVAGHVDDASIHFTEASIDHGAIGGLGDDDHAQYFLLAGRATGQTAIFGTGSGEGGTLQSTSNATKGKVLFGAAGSHAYDEANERWGFGTASPATVGHFVAAAVTPVSTLFEGGVIVEGGSLHLQGNTEGNNRIAWGDDSDNNAGEIKYDHDTNLMTFDANGATRLWLDNAGRLGVGVAPSSTLTVEGGTTSTARLTSTVEDNVVMYGNDAAASTGNYTYLAAKLNTTTQERTAFQIDTRFSDTTDGTRTSEVVFQVNDGGSFTPGFQLAGVTGRFYGRVGIGAAPSGTQLHVNGGSSSVIAKLYASIAASNTFVYVGNQASNSTSNYANIDFRLNTTTQERSAARIRGRLENVTDGSRSGELTFQVFNSGGASTLIQLRDGKLGLYGVAPVVQHSTTGEATGFTVGGGTPVTHTSTFTGNTGTKAYTIGDVVKALKQVGLMASS